MPTLPTTRVSGLMHVKPGSLVSLKNNSAGKLVFGFCVTTVSYPDDPKEVALVVLSAVDGRINASLVPNRATGVGEWVVNGQTRVVDHGLGYSIHVHAKDWDGELKQQTFAPADAGLLLLSESDGLRLAVSVPYAGGCQLLDMKAGALCDAGVGNTVAAKTWRLSLPWKSDDVEWPLERSPAATPEEITAAITRK